MTPEWIAAPSLGVHRWLSLELGRRLGVAAPGQSDGVSANVTRAFPDTLRDRVLERGAVGMATPGRSSASSGRCSPWPPARRRRPPHRLLTTGSRTLALRPGAPRGRPVRRYHRHRPAMVRAWRAGLDIDGLGQPLGGTRPGSRTSGGSSAGRSHSRAHPSAPRSSSLAWPTARSSSGFPIASTCSGWPSCPAERTSSISPRGLPPPTSCTSTCSNRAITTKRRCAACSTGPGGSDRGPVRRSEPGLDCHPLLASWGALLRETSVLLAASTSLPAPQRCPRRWRVLRPHSSDSCSGSAGEPPTGRIVCARPRRSHRPVPRVPRGASPGRGAARRAAAPLGRPEPRAAGGGHRRPLPVARALRPTGGGIFGPSADAPPHRWRPLQHRAFATASRTDRCGRGTLCSTPWRCWSTSSVAASKRRRSSTSSRLRPCANASG